MKYIQATRPQIYVLQYAIIKITKTNSALSLHHFNLKKTINYDNVIGHHTKNDIISKGKPANLVLYTKIKKNTKI